MSNMWLLCQNSSGCFVLSLRWSIGRWISSKNVWVSELWEKIWGECKCVLTFCLHFTPEKLGTEIYKHGIDRILETDYTGGGSCVSVLLPSHLGCLLYTGMYLTVSSKNKIWAAYGESKADRRRCSSHHGFCAYCCPGTAVRRADAWCLCNWSLYSGRNLREYEHLKCKVEYSVFGSGKDKYQ